MLQFSQSRLLLIGLFVILSTVILRGGDVVAATPTPAQVLAGLQSRRDSVENLKVEATWEQFQDGAPSSWEEERIYRDNLGRIRVRYYHGTGALGAGHKRMVDDLYNGEITVDLIEDPSLNRLGEAFKPGEKADSKNRYRAAIIHNGEFPPNKGLSSHRDPLTGMDGSVIRDLSKLLAGGKTVTVDPVSGQQNVYELSYKLDPQDNPDDLKNHVLVDAGKGWVVKRVEQFFPDGKSARLRTCDYKQDDSGLWVPTKGQFRNLWGKEVPDLDWRFTVQRCVINDPDFDESVFDVKLDKGVWVTDNRYNVSYWVGDDVVSADDLASMAEKAREAEKSRYRPAGIAEDASSRSVWLRRVSIAVCVLLIIIVGTILVCRRTGGRKSAS